MGRSPHHDDNLLMLSNMAFMLRETFSCPDAAWHVYALMRRIDPEHWNYYVGPAGQELLAGPPPSSDPATSQGEVRADEPGEAEGGYLALPRRLVGEWAVSGEQGPLNAEPVHPDDASEAPAAPTEPKEEGSRS